MKKALYVLVLALIATTSLPAAQLMLLQGGFSDGSARSASANFILEQATGFPFGGISSSAGFLLASGFYPIGPVASGMGVGGQRTDGSTLPKTLILDHPYPNPGLQPVIRFGLPRAAPVSLRVYNVLGQEVAVLADGVLSAGWHTVNWNGRGENGRCVTAGVYLLRLTAADKSLTQKLTVVR